MQQREWTAVLAPVALDGGRDLGEGRHPGRHDRRQSGPRDAGGEVDVRDLAAGDLHDLDPKAHEARHALRIERRREGDDAEPTPLGHERGEVRHRQLQLAEHLYLVARLRSFLVLRERSGRDGHLIGGERLELHGPRPGRGGGSHQLEATLATSVVIDAGFRDHEHRLVAAHAEGAEGHARLQHSAS